MLIGSYEATLRQVQRVDIHGTIFWDLLYQHDDSPGQLRQARVAAESISGELRPDDRVRISYLMGAVTAVEQRDS